MILPRRCRSWRRTHFRLALVILALVVVLLLMLYLLPVPVEIGKSDEDVMYIIRSDGHQREYIDRKGIHVVVGHYIGDDIITGNLTEAMVNQNNYSPELGAGNDGVPVELLPHQLPKMKLLYPINQFNLLVSDKIPVNRSLPDVRKKQCSKQDINVNKIKSTSVIIVFHNEAWSTLMRTVHSIINRSPKNLLKEIILVDDASTREFLGESLERYVRQLPVYVKIVRCKERTGLIRARIRGARVAQGEILTFLDAHCEVTEGWLENLLVHIMRDRTRVVCPVIDVISDDTFAYIRSFELHWGAINWHLHFRWFAVSGQELRDIKPDGYTPFKTPIMAGGLFAIDKEYFFEMGAYDEEMDIWGGENIEMSLRIWQCGGSVVIAPCSHVGHVFRKTSPYTFPNGVGNVLHRNLARVAKVWMDDWENFFFLLNKGAKDISNTVSVMQRKHLRERLGCKSFGWFLDNIWPDNFFPSDTKLLGQIIHEEAGNCLTRVQGKSGENSGVLPLILKECDPSLEGDQLFVWTDSGQVMGDDSLCLDCREPGAEHSEVKMVLCSSVSRQKWEFKEKQIKHVKSGKCLSARPASESLRFTLTPCDSLSAKQWHFQQVTWR